MTATATRTCATCGKPCRAGCVTCGNSYCQEADVCRNQIRNTRSRGIRQAFNERLAQVTALRDRQIDREAAQGTK